jgi:hypothetical protein
MNETKHNILFFSGQFLVNFFSLVFLL